MFIEDGDQVKDDNRWSSLPTLLLWMINSRLDYHNSFRFSIVCKHWNHAVLHYPPRFEDEFEVDNSPPWIMSYKGMIADIRREFFNPLTEECYTIDNPGFCATDVLYSRQGWLLMVRLKLKKSKKLSNRVNKKLDSPYVLLNPFKNKAINLPFLNIKFQGAFTIQDGNPHTIILARSDNAYRSTIDLYITHPGDNAWLRYSHTCMVREIFFYPKFVRCVFIIRELVYFITERVGVVIFNITNQQWMEVKGRVNPHTDVQHLVERRGEILRLHFNPEADVYKLTIVGEKICWKYIDRRVFTTCVWFLTRLQGRSFIFETEGHDLVKLKRASRFCASNKSRWVHMC